MFGQFSSEVGSDLRANGFPQGGLSAFLRGYFIHAGCYLLVNYRVTRALARGGSLSRFAGYLIAAHTTARTGCFVSPQAAIEPGVMLPHATGIVIGIGVRIAAGATIYQGVTLGEGATDAARYPVVERGATLYAGAKVLGGVRIGRDAVVGANAVVLRSVPDDAVAVGVPARILPSRARQAAGGVTNAVS